MIYEVILNYTEYPGADEFLREEHGMPFRDNVHFRYTEIADALKNSDKEWSYAYVQGKMRYYLKSEIAAIEFKLRFG